jgi:hypothetical protein
VFSLLEKVQRNALGMGWDDVFGGGRDDCFDFSGWRQTFGLLFEVGSGLGAVNVELGVSFLNYSHVDLVVVGISAYNRLVCSKIV